MTEIDDDRIDPRYRFSKEYTNFSSLDRYPIVRAA